MNALARFRLIGKLEACSFLFLLGIAMPLKYVWHRPAAVHFAGSLHGLLFLLYLAGLYQLATEHAWPIRRIGLALVASVLPAGPFIFDRTLRDESAAESPGSAG